MALPYEDFIKSSTSWVMVVTPIQYFRPRFTRPNKKEAPSSDCMSHQASSITKILFFTLVRTVFQMYRMIINKAMGFKDSSISRKPNTTKPLSMEMLDFWLKNPEKVPWVNFFKRLAKDD